MIHSISLVTLVFLPWALAAFHPKPLHIPIRRNDVSDRVAGLPRAIDGIKRKYGFTSHTKRSGEPTVIPLTDEQNDLFYSAAVSIGTPLQDFNLMIDTGSADLWVVTTACTTCPSNITMFDPSRSSTYQSFSDDLTIAYGSGAVTGSKSEDTAVFGGFSVQNHLLLSVDYVDNPSGLLGPGTSGIMGLGFQDISTLQALPFWQELYNQNLLPEPMFAVYLERHVDQSAHTGTAPGGVFTLGGTNSSLYTGSIEYIDMPDGTTPSYWLQQVQSMVVQGKVIGIRSNETLAMIDTGTSLIGAPASVTQIIWENVPGAVTLSGDYEGMYGFPCSTSVDVSISFGGTSWAIDPADMNFGPLESDPSMCIGGIFTIANGVGGDSFPSWVIGDVFLKNVYTVFRADPPSVGFAQLANNLDSTSHTSGGSHVTRSLPLASLSVILPLLACFYVAL